MNKLPRKELIDLVARKAVEEIEILDTALVWLRSAL